jgi:hypothetical protein
MTDDELFANWGDWISRTANELTEVFEHRYLFNTVRAMFDHNPKLHTQSGQFIMDWQAKLYGRDVLLFIRREFDYQHGTENILHLLREMQTRPTIVNRGRYRARVDKLNAPEEFKERFANSFFNTFKVIGDGKSPTDYLDPAGIAETGERLKKGIDKVLLYANRNLAHRTPDWEVQQIMIPTDTDAALAAVRDCFDRFYPLLTGKSMPDPTPTIQFDWEESFRYQWMTDDVAIAMMNAEEEERQRKSQEALNSLKHKTV